MAVLRLTLADSGVRPKRIVFSGPSKRGATTLKRQAGAGTAVSNRY